MSWFCLHVPASLNGRKRVSPRRGQTDTKLHRSQVKLKVAHAIRLKLGALSGMRGKWGEGEEEGERRCAGADNTASVSIAGLSYGRLHQSKRIINKQTKKQQQERERERQRQREREHLEVFFFLTKVLYEVYTLTCFASFLCINGTNVNDYYIITHTHTHTHTYIYI